MKKHISREFFTGKRKTKDWGGGYGRGERGEKHFSELDDSTLAIIIQIFSKEKQGKIIILLVYIYYVYIYREDVFTRREKE